MSLLTFGVHTFIGGPRVAAPLLASGALPPASKWLNYYCWHVTTIVIVFITCGFAWLALTPLTADRTVILGALCALTGSLALLSAAVARKGGIRPLRFPSTSLFGATAVLGLFALLLRS